MSLFIPTASATSLRFSRIVPVPFSMLVLTVLTVCALFMYGYSLRVAISYAVEREGVIEDIALLRASVASLEGSYVSLTKDLSIEKARTLGFHEAADPLYISVAPAPSVVGLRSR